MIFWRIKKLNLFKQLLTSPTLPFCQLLSVPINYKPTENDSWGTPTSWCFCTRTMLAHRSYEVLVFPCLIVVSVLETGSHDSWGVSQPWAPQTDPVTLSHRAQKRTPSHSLSPVPSLTFMPQSAPRCPGKLQRRPRHRPWTVTVPPVHSVLPQIK